MGDSAKRGHSPDMSGLKEGKVSKWCNANTYVKEPKNSYGKGSKPLQPSKARTHSYTPEDKNPDNSR